MPLSIYPIIPKSENVKVEVMNFTPDIKYEIQDQLFKLVLDTYGTTCTQRKMARLLGISERTFRTRLAEVRERYAKYN